MRLSGIRKSQVSTLCKEIGEGGRIVSVAAIIAVAANTNGRREIVGPHIGPSEAETF
jgi:transposase-like protein